MENCIKELKHGFGMVGLPPELLHTTVATVRWRVYQTAARLVRHARRLVLKVATDAETFAMLRDLRLVARSLAFP
jgi:hypothetical protein